MNQDTLPNKIAPVLFTGIDWADQAHDCSIVDAQGKGQHQRLKQPPEAIEQWVKQKFELSVG